MKPIAITIIVVGFLFFLKFQFPHYRVYSNHMKPTLQKGDVILVNKFIRGNRFKNNDICVFNFNDEHQISRIVGLPNDKIQINDGVLYVNDTLLSNVLASYKYKVKLGDHPALAANDLLLLLEPSNAYQEYSAELTEMQANQIAELEFVVSIEKIIHPKGYHYTFLEHSIFSNGNSLSWSRDNFGPLTVPQGYYFMLGDNRHQSLDSRYIGLIPEKDIKGKMIATLYSPNA